MKTTLKNIISYKDETALVDPSRLSVEDDGGEVELLLQEPVRVQFDSLIDWTFLSFVFVASVLLEEGRSAAVMRRIWRPPTSVLHSWKSIRRQELSKIMAAPEIQENFYVNFRYI